VLRGVAGRGGGRADGEVGVSNVVVDIGHPRDVGTRVVATCNQDREHRVTNDMFL
jgi:hypothetical protein